MIAKRIDRYVSFSFLLMFFGILAVVFGLYVAYDLLKRVEELQELGTGEILPAMFTYYGYVFPVFALDSVPAIVALAAGLTLVKMSKRRELLTLKASGVSVYRAIAPIFFWTLLVSVGVLWARERIVPAIVQQKELMARQLSGDMGRGLLLKDRQFNFKLFVNSYDFSNHSMKQVSVIELHPELTVKRIVEADEGHWAGDGLIRLEGVNMRDFDAKGAKAGQPTTMASTVIETALSPFDFVRARSESAARSLFLTLSQLAARMRDNPNVPHYRVVFHSRLASAFTSFVVLLLVIPLLVGFEHSAHSRFVGAVVCIFVVLLYHAMVFVSASVGESGAVHPVLAGWMPVIIAGPCGIWLFESMLT